VERRSISPLYRNLALLGVLAGLAGSASAAVPDHVAVCCEATFRVRVPEGTPTVFIAGGLPELGPWRPDGRALEGKDRDRSVTLTLRPDAAFEYKFTLGSWDREALAYAGGVPPDHRLVIAGDTVVAHEIADLRKDPLEYIATGPARVCRAGWSTGRTSGPRSSTRRGTGDLADAWLRRRSRGPLSCPVHARRPESVRSTDSEHGHRLGASDETVVRLVRAGVIPPVIVVGAVAARVTGEPGSAARDTVPYIVRDIAAARRVPAGTRHWFDYGTVGLDS
jgi:hypothetical protein